MRDVESVGIGCLDRLICEIHQERQHKELVQKANTMRAQVKEIEKFLNLLKNQLIQMEEKLTMMKMDPASISNCPIKVFRRPRSLKELASSSLF